MNITCTATKKSPANPNETNSDFVFINNRNNVCRLLSSYYKIQTFQ